MKKIQIFKHRDTQFILSNSSLCQGLEKPNFLCYVCCVFAVDFKPISSFLLSQADLHKIAWNHKIQAQNYTLIHLQIPVSISWAKCETHGLSEVHNFSQYLIGIICLHQFLAHCKFRLTTILLQTSPSPKQTVLNPWLHARALPNLNTIPGRYKSVR
jgi:hypothetical protein